MGVTNSASEAKGVGAAVFLKPLHLAKSRLDHLSPTMRADIATAMARDLLAAVTASAVFDRVILVSPDLAVRQLAEAYRVEHVDGGTTQGLNHAAAQGIIALGQRGIQRAVLLPGDMPLVDAASLRNTVLTLDRAMDNGADIGLVPCRHEDGTNLLMCNVAQSPAFRYGKGSFAAHAAGAQAPALHRDRSIGLDIDRPEDLVELERRIAAMTRPPRYTAAAIGKFDWRHAA